MSTHTERFDTEAEMIAKVRQHQKNPVFVKTVMLNAETALTFQGGKAPHWYVKGCMEKQKQLEVNKKDTVTRLRLKLLKKKLALTE